MPTVFARHITAMMRGPLGVDVVVGGVATRGLWDEQGTLDRDAVGEHPVFERVLTLNATTARIPLDTTITVNTVAYVVRTPPLPMEDGGLVRYGVALVAPDEGTA